MVDMIKQIIEFFWLALIFLWYSNYFLMAVSICFWKNMMAVKKVSMEFGMDVDAYEHNWWRRKKKSNCKNLLNLVIWKHFLSLLLIRLNDYLFWNIVDWKTWTENCYLDLYFEF